MRWLNYHHLLYFWHVAREGSIARAGELLQISQPTISGQLKSLEQEVGGRLFIRTGRKMQLTETGQVVFQYANEIFALGTELMDIVGKRPAGRPMRLSVGVLLGIPKLVARQFIQPSLTSLPDLRLNVCQGDIERLMTMLAEYKLDVIISDEPISASAKFKGSSHLLCDCGISFFAKKTLADRLTGPFPQCLDGIPMYLPTEGSPMRRALTDWFARVGIKPRITGEFEDSSLLKTFAQNTDVAFASPAMVQDELCRQHDVVPIGRCEDIRERFYAVTVERRIEHPGVTAMCEAHGEQGNGVRGTVATLAANGKAPDARYGAPVYPTKLASPTS